MVDDVDSIPEWLSIVSKEKGQPILTVDDLDVIYTNFTPLSFAYFSVKLTNVILHRLFLLQFANEMFRFLEQMDGDVELLDGSVYIFYFLKWLLMHTTIFHVT